MAGRPITIAKPASSSGGDAPADWSAPRSRESAPLDTVTPFTEYVALPVPSWTEVTSFETFASPGVAMRRVISAVQLEGEVLAIKPQKCKIKCRIMHNFSLCEFQITMYRAASPNTHIMEFQKRRGDSFMWDSVFSQLFIALADLFPSAAALRKPVTPEKPELAVNELQTLAMGLLEAGSLEAQNIAAHALAHAAANISQVDSASLLALSEASDTEIQHLVEFTKTTLSTREEVPMTSAAAIGSPPRAWCMSDLFFSSCNCDMGMGAGTMLSSSA